LKHIHEERLSRLRGYLEQYYIDSFIIINVEGSERHNIYYLTGFFAAYGCTFLIVTSDTLIFLADSNDYERAKKELPDVEIEEINEAWRDDFVEYLNKTNAVKIGINSRKTSFFDYNYIESRLDSKELVPVPDPVMDLRQIKDAEETDSIRKAVRLTDQAYDHLLGSVKLGMTEKELAWILERYMRENGADGLAFNTIIACGSNTPLVHHLFSDTKLKRGDLVLVDFAARVDRYCADMTRVFAMGKPTAKQKEIYGIVLAAQENALQNIVPGISGKDADKLARGVIEDAGYGESFGHALGHSLGLEIHESIGLSPVEERELKPGMAVTVEPGIYLPNSAVGVRIEDVAIIEEEGCRNLTRSPKDRLLVV